MSLSSTAFSDTKVTEIDIVIKPQTYLNLFEEKNKRKEYPVFASIDGGEYFPVNINTRGSGAFTYSMMRKSPRLPLKLSFDAYSFGSDLFDNQSLKLISTNNLYTLVSEFLALKIFEHMGYPATEARPVFLTMNGVDYGLYLGVEAINRDFIIKHFGYDSLKNCNLYKSVDLISIDDGTVYSNQYFGNLVHVFGNTDHSNIFHLFNSVQWNEDYTKYINVDDVIKFFACCVCSGGADTFMSYAYGCIHNFYLYESNGKFTLIPWDLSYAFNCFGNNQSIFPDKANSTTTEFFDKIMSEEENRKKYVAYIEEIRETFLKPEIINPLLTEFTDSLREYCARDRSTDYSTEVSLSHITDGNVLLDGNIILAVNEVYRQLREQIDGSADHFYVPEGVYANTVDMYGMEKAASPDYTSVKEEVIRNYFSSQWKTLLSRNRENPVIVVPVFLAVLVTMYLVYRIPKGKKSKIS